MLKCTIWMGMRGLLKLTLDCWIELSAARVVNQRLRCVCCRKCSQLAIEAAGWHHVCYHQGSSSLFNSSKLLLYNSCENERMNRNYLRNDYIYLKWFKMVNKTSNSSAHSCCSENSLLKKNTTRNLRVSQVGIMVTSLIRCQPWTPHTHVFFCPSHHTV